VHKNGHEIMVAVTVSPIRDAAGKVTGTSAILRDITEQRQAQERMQNLQAELIHLSRWNTMGMMASTIAHELNQPLTAVMNYIRAARRTIDSPEPKPVRVAEFLDKAVAETKVASGIIRSLREFIDKRQTTRAPENLNAVVEESVGLSRAALGGAAMNVRLRLDPLLSPVFIDRIQIEQVLINLIRNALEAMDSSGELVIATGPAEAGFVGVAVGDTGSGIAPDVLKRLFEPFVTTKEKGMGIGLTICHSIVEAHGGRIWAEPNKPKGTIFRFRLPVTAEAVHGE
jgi:two-component system sensor kinase FixL